MFCGTCGTKNSDLNRFCRECGKRLPERPQSSLSEEQFADLRAPGPEPPVDAGKVAVLMDVACSYHREGKLDQAIATCLEVIALSPRNTSAHSLLAVVHEERGQFDEAVVHLRRVLELNPNSAADRENLARILGESLPPQLASPAAPPHPIFSNRPLLAGLGAFAVVAAVMVPVSLRALRGPAAPPAATASLDAGRRPAPSPPPAATTPQPTSPAPQAMPAAPTPAQRTPAPRAGLSPAFEEEPEPAAPSAPPAMPAMPSAAASEEPVEPLPQPRRQPVSPPVVVVPSRRGAAPPGPQPWGEPGPVARATVPYRPAAPSQPAPSMETTFTPAHDVPPGRAGGSAGSTSSPDPRIVVRTSPTTPGDYARWGMEAAGEGKYDDAVGHYQKALEGMRTPADRGRMRQHMAYAYQQLGRRAEAEQSYREAIDQYKEQLNQGTNADLARAGIRASEQGLRGLGM